ncbi:2Fe-2S ferredoxin-type domain-containing protein [Gautieria morchelliformis]|nr:2Fe-2S ferredoxin-type domain-containing protein [Gautieria morchelliformis]
MSLRGLQTFIFASEARLAQYTHQGATLCRPRSSTSTCARRLTSLSTCAPQSGRREQRIGRGSYLCDAAPSCLAGNGARKRLLMLMRLREWERCRGFHSSTPRFHETIVRPAPGTGITIHFQDSKGQPVKTIEANDGDNILDLAHEYDVDLEGACEGSVACSTCHVILTPQHYDLLPEPEDDENDMLDMAFGLTDTSRLGCQVKMTPALDGMVVTLPSATRNMFVDGVKPTKH